MKKVGQDVVSLGFPVSSAEKLLEGRVVNDFGQGIMVNIDAGERINQNEYEAWKAGVADATSAPLNSSVASSVSEPQIHSNENELIQMLMNFPLESRTPLDCMIFNSYKTVFDSHPHTLM